MKSPGLLAIEYLSGIGGHHGAGVSWDLLLHSATEPPPPVAQMADDLRGAPLGTLAEVGAKIDARIPGVD